MTRQTVGRGPILMDRYYNKPDLTAQTVRDGRLYSGDVGWVDDEGFRHLMDRKKDMIDSGGIKVYPRDVEEVAICPAVLEVAVFRHPGREVGRDAGCGRGAAQAWRGNRGRTPRVHQPNVGARYQRVTRVIVMDGFPRNAAGETLKHKLHAAFWRGARSRPRRAVACVAVQGVDRMRPQKR
jgi:long-chain acyl-CoA synthetase